MNRQDFITTVCRTLNKHLDNPKDTLTIVRAIADYVDDKTKTVTPTDIIECPVCDGTCGVEAPVEKGAKMGYEWRRCENCNGSGKVRIPGAPVTPPDLTASFEEYFAAQATPTRYHSGEMVLYQGQRYAIAYLAGRVAGEARWALAGRIGQPPAYAMESELTQLATQDALIADTAKHAADDYRELLDTAALLYHAVSSAVEFLRLDIDPCMPSMPVLSKYETTLRTLREAQQAAAPILATEGAIGDAPEAPDFDDTYDGFGPMGPPDSSITQGVDPSIYDHPPTCDCPSCRGDEPPQENLFDEN